jgi:zinc resistance-associated protein
MNKKTIIGLAVVLGLLIMSAVYASGYRGPYEMSTCQTVDLEKVKQFQKETLSLRDELITKRLELRQECGKQGHDSDRITALRNEIRDIRSKIKEVADKYEVPTGCMKGHDRAERCKGGPVAQNRCRNW